MIELIQAGFVARFAKSAKPRGDVVNERYDEQSVLTFDVENTRHRLILRKSKVSKVYIWPS